MSKLCLTTFCRETTKRCTLAKFRKPHKNIFTSVAPSPLHHPACDTSCGFKK